MYPFQIDTDFNLDYYFLQSDVEVAEAAEEEVIDDDDEELQGSSNSGYIELALKVMARMCDGQNHTLQVC